MGDKEFEGVVTQKNPLGFARSDTTGTGLGARVNVQEAKEFKVVVQLKNIPDDVRDALRPGMTSTATITTKTKQNVVAVPLQAIVEKSPNPSPTPGGTPQGAQQPAATPVGERPKEIKGVYILQANNKAKFVPVETGITGESDIEITSGLNPGMEVITGPSRVLRTLKDNDSVKKQSAKPGGSPGEEKK
jgi:HlyD family secretion protein